MGFTREQYLQSAQKALMFFAINVALITYHKLNKGAADGDAAAFEAAEYVEVTPAYADCTGRYVEVSFPRAA